MINFCNFYNTLRVVVKKNFNKKFKSFSRVHSIELGCFPRYLPEQQGLVHHFISCSDFNHWWRGPVNAPPPHLPVSILKGLSTRFYLVITLIGSKFSSFLLLSLLFQFISHFYREHQLIIILSKAKKHIYINIVQTVWYPCKSEMHIFKWELLKEFKM